MTDTPQPLTPSLDAFLVAYAADDNEWWRLDCGDHQNLFDEAIDRLNASTAPNLPDAVRAVIDLARLAVDPEASDYARHVAAEERDDAVRALAATPTAPNLPDAEVIEALAVLDSVPPSDVLALWIACADVVRAVRTRLAAAPTEDTPDA